MFEVPPRLKDQLLHAPPDFQTFRHFCHYVTLKNSLLSSREFARKENKIESQSKFRFLCISRFHEKSTMARADLNINKKVSISLSKYIPTQEAQNLY